MAASRKSGRYVAVRLTEVPPKIRRRFGKRLYEHAVLDRDIVLAAQLHAAMEEPSDRVYWVPKAAAEKVLNGR